MISLLHLKGIDTSDSEEYKLKFAEEGYTRGSIQDIADVVGDTSRPPFNSRLGYKHSTHAVNADILKKELQLIDNELNTIFTQTITIEEIRQHPLYQSIMTHFQNNQLCRKIIYFHEIKNITYPDTNTVEDLKTIFRHYKALQIVISGKKIDEWIDGFSEVQNIFIREFDAVFSFITNNHTPTIMNIKRTGMYQNSLLHSFNSAKYGFADFGWGPFPLNLFNSGLLDITNLINKRTNNEGTIRKSRTLKPIEGPIIQSILTDGSEVNTSNSKKIRNSRAIPIEGPTTQFEIPRTNNSSGNAFTGGLEVPFSDTAISLKMLIAMQFFGISSLLLAFVHEYCHEIGASTREGLHLNFYAITLVERYLPKSIIYCAYRNKINKTVSSDSLNSMYGEHMADFLGVLFVDRYIKDLEPNNKYQEVLCSTAAFNSGNNIIDAGHPPYSLRRNLILISKNIHDVLKENMPDYDTERSKAQNITCDAWNPTGHRLGGFKKSRKNKKNKNRKSRRHRM